MKFTMADYDRIKAVTGSPFVLQKSEPTLVTDPNVIADRALEISNLGLMMIRLGQTSPRPRTTGQNWSDVFKSKVRSYVSDIADVQIFMDAISMNLFLDSGNTDHVRSVMYLVQDALQD